MNEVLYRSNYGILIADKLKALDKEGVRAKSRLSDHPDYIYEIVRE